MESADQGWNTVYAKRLHSSSSLASEYLIILDDCITISGRVPTQSIKFGADNCGLVLLQNTDGRRKSPKLSRHSRYQVWAFPLEKKSSPYSVINVEKRHGMIGCLPFMSK